MCPALPRAQLTRPVAPRPASWYSSTLCIVYALTPAPVGQPRQILAAHLWNMLVGLAVRGLPGGAAAPSLWRPALAVSLGVSGQAYLGVLHPPATGLSLAFASDLTWTWTTLVAVCVANGVVVVMAMAYLNLSEKKQFPLYWLGFGWGGSAGTPVGLARSTARRGARTMQKGWTNVAGSIQGHTKKEREEAV